MALFSSKLRILPALILVAALSFTVRIGEFVAGAGSLGGAMAQQTVDAMPPPLPEQGEPSAEAMPDPASPESARAVVATESLVPSSSGSANWRGSIEESESLDETRMKLFADLAERRRDLEVRERALATQEALLEAAERELEQKLMELQALRDEIRQLLGTQSEAEKERIESLVKVYEGMKAKDAARIFDTLDMDVLISVMEKMSERRIAPILAAMNPARARTVTTRLAEQKRLPAIAEE